MLLEEAWALAAGLISEFGLADSYTVAFKRGRKWLGMCRFPTADRLGEIQLNLAYVETKPRENVEDTIRHEIAHALADKMYGHIGHGNPWKQACAITGARPQRLASPSETVPGPWQARFKGCNGMMSRFRPPKPDRIYYCVRCGDVHGQLQYRKVA